MENTKRGRVWAVIAYPETLPSDWLSYLKNLHVPMAISPLHEGGDDEIKPHYHVLLTFDGNKTRKQVQALTDAVHGTQPIRVESVGGYARYLCHLDEDDKPRYDTADVISLSGFNFAQYLKPSDTKAAEIVDAIDSYILGHEVTELCDLLGYARTHEPEWNKVLHSPAQMARAERIIRSVRYSRCIPARRAKIEEKN